MSKCAVPGCKSFYRNQTNLQPSKVYSFRFPEGPVQRRKWIKEIGVKSISKDATMCQDHFMKSYFVPKEENVGV